MNGLTHLDLFSGIGGFALAAQWAGFRTIGFCEIDKYCQRVLAKNFGAEDVADANTAATNETYSQQERRAATELEDFRASVHADIRELNGRYFAGVTLITGGFPCQPFSVAGKRRGAADDRAIWPQMFRVVDEARPAWVLGENVAGIIGMELDTVLSDLERIGYATRTFIIPACAVDARHRRDRVWIVANSTERKSRGLQQRRIQSDACDDSNRRPEALTWLPEPDVDRVANGVPARVDRLKGLGNAIVPQVAYQILKEIAEIEK